MVRALQSWSGVMLSNASVSHVEELGPHRQLAAFNRTRLQPSEPAGSWPEQMKHEIELRLVEAKWVEGERERVASQAVRAPLDPDGFVRWFEGLKDEGAEEHEHLLGWLASSASLFEMKWFLSQELASVADFEDLVAMTQVKLPPRAKVELARNYWDEMGQGTEGGMHARMLQTLVQRLGLDGEAVAVQSLAVSNLMVALAANRHYTYQSVGALGVVELTRARRAGRIDAGLKRLGVSIEVRRFYSLQATADRRRSDAWNREVIRPLVEKHPAIAHAIAEGALMRTGVEARACERYRREMGLVEDVARPLVFQAPAA